MGYQGTLRPVQSQNLPPAIEMLLEPWLAQASSRLNQCIPAALRVFQGEPVALDSLLPLLKDRLIGILIQAVGVRGIRPGEPSAEESTREFPLLSALVRSAISEWVAAIGTFLQRLHRDQSRLAMVLQLGELPPIESISGTASDMHPGGHSVLRVCFRGGGCLYYKPRPLTGEWLWHELLGAIAVIDPQLQLPAARVLAGDANSSYGWAASVNPDESFLDTNAAAAMDYWHAAGAMLCLAQFVRLTDLHLGNIIATPSGPAVTDAECLATPILRSLSPKCPRQRKRPSLKRWTRSSTPGCCRANTMQTYRTSPACLVTPPLCRGSDFRRGRYHPTAATGSLPSARSLSTMATHPRRPLPSQCCRKCWMATVTPPNC